MPSAASKKILIIAAETSSSLYAQRLLEHWKKNNLPIEAFGIGSRSMEKLGFECLGRAEDLAVVGVWEVLAHFSEIRAVFYKLIEAAKIRKPEVVLLLDYPDFNFRLAKKLKKLGFPIVYYISPQLWAWRTSRITLVQKFIDKMLVLFPFEVDFYKQHQVKVDFVGHPLLDELQRMSPSAEAEKDRLVHRRRFGFQDEDFVVGLMPGSRNSELKHHLETQIQVASQLVRRFSHVKIAFLVAPNFDKKAFQNLLGDLDFPYVLVQEEPFDMIRMTDGVLVASGTATLMVGLMEKPMVIMYKMNWFSSRLAKWFVNKTPYFGLINLVLGKRTVPELFQEQANPHALVDELSKFISDSSYRRNTIQELAQAKLRLGSSGATMRVAEALNEYFGDEFHAS